MCFRAETRQAVLGAVLVSWALPSLADKLSVFVSVPPQRFFLERIGGDEIEVSVLVKAGHSPETYEPTPQQMAALSRAHLYVRIGVPFEEAWMARIASINPQLQIVDARNGLVFGDVAASRVGNPDETEEPLPADRIGTDPHVWLSPPLAEKMAAHLRNTLSALRPQHSARFEINYRNLAADLRRLDHDIRTQLADLETQVFMVYHPAWGYFADTYGLQQIAIEIEGKEPGPRTLSRLIDTAKQLGIKVVFAEAGSSRRHAKTIADAIGARVIVVDPVSEDYPNNLLRFARVLATENQTKK